MCGIVGYIGAKNAVGAAFGLIAGAYKNANDKGAALIAAIYPMIRLSGLQVVEALREE